MNNFFNYDRFSLLVRRQWTENKLILLMSIVIYASITAIFYSINIDFENENYINKTVQGAMFNIGLFGGGTLFANYIFKDFGNNIQTMSFLMTPASHFEKLCTGLFYALIAFPIAFFFVFGAVDFAFVALSGNKSNEILYSLIIESYQGYSFFISLWVTLQIFTMLGAIYFGKMSYIKTAFSGFLTLAIFIFIGYLLVKFIIGNDYNIRMSHADRDSLSDTYKFLDNTIKIYIYYLLIPFFAVITYFKLKEKEV